jgi:hypothetical protein
LWRNQILMCLCCQGVSVVAAATRYGWSASQDLERVWSEADILAAEPGRKHVSVSSRADTSTWFPVGKRPHECVRGSLDKLRKPPDENSA